IAIMILMNTWHQCGVVARKHFEHVRDIFGCISALVRGKLVDCVGASPIVENAHVSSAPGGSGGLVQRPKPPRAPSCRTCYRSETCRRIAFAWQCADG